MEPGPPYPTVPEAGPGRVVVAIIPVGTLEGAKSRLGAVLDAEERHDLATRMAEATMRATVGATSIAETLVVTPDDEVRGLALAAGARPMRQRSRGLNDGLREARDEALAGGATAVLIVPIDLPAISSAAVDAVAAALDAGEPGPLVVLVPDRHGRGTNALLLSPPDVIDVLFGGDSRAAHAAAAVAADARYLELGGPLTLDLDTPDDLLLVDATAPESVRG